MTQKQLAKAAEIHKVYLCQILAGTATPSEKLALELSEITGIRPAVWMRGSTLALRRAWKAYQKTFKEEKRFIAEYNRRKEVGLL